MAVRIRLTKTGKRNDPKFRIVAIEKRSKRDGKYIDKIGFYNPIAQPHELVVDVEKLKSWIQKGAQLSDKTATLVRHLLKA